MIIYKQRENKMYEPVLQKLRTGKPLDLLHRVLGRRWKFMKFDAKINLGAGFALTQIAYQYKARAMESLKMQTRGLWKQRTKSYEPETSLSPASLCWVVGGKS